jgi:YidC/Oxa1 family membrane protein insertase
MAELSNPNQGSSTGVRPLLILLIVIAFLFAVVPRLPLRALRQAISPGSQQTSSIQRKPQAAMNLLERGLFRGLSWLQAHAVARRSGSWGWAIVLLTVGVNLLLLPFRIASIRSGLKKQRLQPEMKLITDRYAGVKLTDPRHAEKNAEIAKLQKDNGVNMFGGCLPLLLQMPLLFAFFGMLRKAVVLQGATWFWLHDLSSADPYHVLPILMGARQLALQLYTPSPGSDLKQQRMMACVTTIGFSYVSWHYASGLALYALTGSLFSIATQTLVNLTGSGRENSQVST